ncbi:phosphopantetheine-binding protein [Streptomyces sp. NBC_00631]|uniref:phosphopantetheine-binding protein n=1 Tax=Streptomyces sp. NBC_00631 TaxID=2975793 RepID=UPI0030E3E9F2
MAIGSAPTEILLRKQLPHITESTAIGPDDPLAGFGLDSLGMVQLVVQLEEICSIEFSDHVLVPETFATIGSIVGVLDTLLATTDVAS